MSDISDWDACDEHEATYPKFGECPYCVIESLQARIPQWISVEDRLPEEGQHILISILHKYSNAPWEYNITYSVYKSGTWRDSDHIYMTPTHWMSLPQPPTEE